jgi:hypothetical protein
MKKVILLSLMTVSTLFTVITKAKAQKGIYAGIQGAAQVSVMFNETDVEKPGADYKSDYGTTFGINGGYNFSNHLGVGTELTYATIKQKYVDNTSNYNQKFSYIKIPVLFTYNSNSKRTIMFTAKAGPQLGVLLKSRITDASNSALNGDTKDQYKKLTFGAMAGAGIRMHMLSNVYLDAGIHLDGTISNTEDKNYAGYSANRSKTHDLNAGLEVGIKYLF